jgi:ribosomal protein S18 acetylase RimI-like enzyme
MTPAYSCGAKMRRACVVDRSVGPFFAGMDVIIRRAQASDVARMLELVQELALFERAPEEVTVTQEHMCDAGFGRNPVWVGWVAELEGTIVGMAVCYERYSTWKGRRLYLEDIIVTERARGQRIGDSLFRQCAAYAVQKDYSGMLWQVLDWNTDAIRFYERFGAGLDPHWVNGSLGSEQLKKIARS